MPTDPRTLLLTRGDIMPLLDATALLSDLRKAFGEYSSARLAPARRLAVPLPAPAPAAASAMILVPGVVRGIPAYSVKVHAKFPGLDPAIQGVIILHDLATGHPLAMLESTFITSARTGLAGAVAADVLANPDARHVAIVGAGVQGIAQLEGLLKVRRIASVRVYDAFPQQARKYAERESARLNVPIQPVSSLAEALEGAEIIVTATWAKEPFVRDGMLAPGTHLSTFGPDQPGKCEVAAEVLKKSIFVCDDRSLAVEMGAVGGAGLGDEAIAAELGEVIAGTKPGRTSPRDITIFGSVGLAFQDLVASWSVYNRAVNTGVGRWIEWNK